MLNKKQVMTTVVLAFLLTIFSLLPIQATAAEDKFKLLWEKELNGRLLDTVSKTPSGDTLLAIYRKNKNNINSSYDFFKINAEGKVLEKKQFKNGVAQIAIHEGKTLIIFANSDTKKLEFMDENYKILASKPLPFDEIIYNLVIQEDILALTFRLPPTNNAQAIFYSLKTFKGVPSSSIPTKEYNFHQVADSQTGAQSYVISYLTFAGTIIKQIPIDLPQFSNARFSDTITERNGYFYAVIDVLEPTQKYVFSVMLFKIDMQGNVVEQHFVTYDDFVGSQYNYDPHSIIIGDQIIIAAQDYWVFNIPSLDFVEKIPSNTENWTLGKHHDNLFYYRVGKEQLYADAKGEVQYKIANEYASIFLNDNYFYTPSGMDLTAHLYNAKTGELVLKGGAFSYTMHDDHLIGYANSGYTSSVKLFKLLSKPLNPISPKVPRSKE